jgi:putative ATP-binding cassette transporter
MDEATSAIDEPGEATLYETLIRELPKAGIVSVGHRSSLIDFHETRLVLEGEGRWRADTIDQATKGRMAV